MQYVQDAKADSISYQDHHGGGNPFFFFFMLFVGGIFFFKRHAKMKKIR